MKKIVTILTLISSILIYSQNSYKEIKTDQLNSGKSQTAKNFIRTFLDKCEDKTIQRLKTLIFQMASKISWMKNLKKSVLTL